MVLVEMLHKKELSKKTTKTNGLKSQILEIFYEYETIQIKSNCEKKEQVLVKKNKRLSKSVFRILNYLLTVD